MQGDSSKAGRVLVWLIQQAAVFRQQYRLTRTSLLLIGALTSVLQLILNDASVFLHSTARTLYFDS